MYVLSRDGIVVFRTLFAPRFLAVVPSHAYTDGRSKNPGSLHLPGWAVEEEHWGPLVLHVGLKCSLVWERERVHQELRSLALFFPLCFHLSFQLDEFSSLMSQRSVVIAGVARCL